MEKKLTEARRSWLLAKLAIDNLAKHLKQENSVALLDALYSCPPQMQDVPWHWLRDRE